MPAGIRPAAPAGTDGLEEPVADLFTRIELAAYAQRDIDNATADLLLALVTAEIRGYVGETAYDALGDVGQVRFKGIALEAVKRAYLNPEGVRQQAHTIDDYQESQTFASETFGGVELTESEQARIDRILGRSGGAFTIRSVGKPDCPPWVSARRRLAAYGQESW